MKLDIKQNNIPSHYAKHLCVMVCVLILCIFQLIVTTTKAHANIPSVIQEAMQEVQLDPKDISIIVQKVMPRHLSKSKNKALVSHLPIKKRLPASILKLFTTFTALDTLGEDFQWVTKVYHTGHIKNGVLYGDLIIKGSADPKLVKEHIIEMLSKVRAHGIQKISGDLILDDSIFQLAAHDPSLFDDKPLRSYNAGASGLLVNFSSLILHFTPNSNTNTADVTFEPIIADTHLPKSVLLDKEKTCKAWRLGLDAKFIDNTLKFGGKYAEKCHYGTWPIAHPNAKHFAKSVLKGNWLAINGMLTGDVYYGRLPKHAQLITTQSSPKLSSIITDINRFSNNVMTEQVFLSLPAYAQKTTIAHRFPVTYPKARLWYSNWWQHNLGHIKGVSAPKLSKASGLCHDCFISPQSMNALLHFAAQHHKFSTFRKSLCLVGVNGAMKSYRYRKPNSPAIENAYVKTGTLDTVTSIAGYVDAQSGTRYSVLAIINKPHAVQSRSVLDAILDWTAKQ